MHRPVVLRVMNPFFWMDWRELDSLDLNRLTIQFSLSISAFLRWRRLWWHSFRIRCWRLAVPLVSDYRSIY